MLHLQDFISAFSIIVNPIYPLASMSIILQGEIGSLRQQLAGLKKDSSASDTPQGTCAYIHYIMYIVCRHIVHTTSQRNNVIWLQ